MSDTISLAGLDKADVLAALYNASTTGGMGFLQYDANQMTPLEARELLDRTTHFDYLKGRVMKIDLSGDDFNPWLYDRDNGTGKAAEVVKVLRQTGDSNAQSIQDTHNAAVQTAAVETRAALSEPTIKSVTHEGGMAVIEFGGFSDVADVLGPAIDRASK